MNNKGIAPLQVLLPVLVLLIIGVFSFSYRSNVSESVSDVLAAVNSKVTQVTGRSFSQTIPDLEVAEEYKVIAYYSTPFSQNREADLLNIEISGPGAKKVADYFNKYAYLNRGVRVYSAYPYLGSVNEKNSNERGASLSFAKDPTKTDVYKSNFNVYYTDNKIEFPFLKNVKNFNLYPSEFSKESSNILVRDLEDLVEFQFIRSTSTGIAFGIKLRGENAYQIGSELRKDLIEIELSNGQTQKIFVDIRPSSVNQGYWGQISQGGEVKSIRFAKSYPFEITYTKFVDAGPIKDWTLSPDRKSITRKISTPSTELITTSVSFVGSCPNFAFYNKTKCKLLFNFLGTDAQITKLMNDAKAGVVSVQRLSDVQNPLSPTYEDKNINFVFGKKALRQGKTANTLTIEIPSDTRKIEFYSTGLKFNFFRVPSDFSNMGNTSLLKLR